MASAKNQPLKPGPSIATAAAKAGSAIRDLQAKLKEASQNTAFPQAAVAERQPTERAESEEDLERQLEAYFAGSGRARVGPAGSLSRTAILDELRNRVIDGVVDRILDEWARGESGLGDEVMDRLIERVLEQVRRVPEQSKTALGA